MSDSRTYTEVTPDIWDRVKSYGRETHGTVYEPVDGPTGTATTKTPIGDVVLTFALDAESSTITYGIKKKPFLVMSSQIWNGIESTIENCRSQT